MKSDSMQVDKEIQYLVPYKYLDSLDTVRYKYIDSPIENGVYLHAYSDILLTLIMGEGIAVPDNQLVDSPAFIDVASQLINAAKNARSLDRLNLRANLFKSNSAFQVAVKIFGAAGTKKENYKDRYVISGWPFLDYDDDNPDRRALWAERFSQSLPIPDNSTYIKHPIEFLFAQKLYKVLAFFDSPEGQHKKDGSEKNKEFRRREINQFAQIPDEQIVAGKYRLTKKDHVLLDAIQVIKKLVENLPDYDERSKIVTELLMPNSEDEINPLYFDNVESPNAVHSAVLTMIDNVYNFSSAYAVKADFATLTAKVGSPESHFLSLFWTSAWGRIMDKAEHGFVMNMPYGEMAVYSVKWDNILSSRENMELFQKESFPWEQFFLATLEPTWRKSLRTYLKALDNFRKRKTEDAAVLKGEYLKAREEHLSVSSEKFPENYLEISEKEVKIRLKELKKMIEAEKTYEDSQSIDKGSTQGQLYTTSTELGSELGAEIGALPKVETKLSGKLAAQATRSTEKYDKQISSLKNMVARKGNEDIIDQIDELQRQFETDTPKAAQAISGLISTFKSNVS